MNRRTFTLAAATAPLVACGWDKHFELGWREEVLLHDGRVIEIEVKHVFQRLSQSFTRYGGTSIQRDTFMTLDVGGDRGRVTQLFKGYQPQLLDQHEGIWYVVLTGGHYYRSNEVPGQNWGCTGTTAALWHISQGLASSPSPYMTCPASSPGRTSLSWLASQASLRSLMESASRWRRRKSGSDGSHTGL